MPDYETDEQVISSNDAIQALSMQVNEVQVAGSGLMAAMEDQIKAVISSDALAMVQCTEQIVNAQQRFHLAEQGVIKALASCIPAPEQDRLGISFETLTALHPRLERQFDACKMVISGTVDRLQLKHSQLVELLEFAQTQNVTMMRSFYGLQNAKHTHYRHNGEKTGVMSGMAVNQEG